MYVPASGTAGHIPQMTSARFYKSCTMCCILCHGGIMKYCGALLARSEVFRYFNKEGNCYFLWGRHVLYCVFRKNMIQMRGDFCTAKSSTSPRTVTVNASEAVNQCQLVKSFKNRINGLNTGIKCYSGMNPGANDVDHTICRAVFPVLWHDK